ncbi:hypothetical protein BJY04DRAFT_188092 [Aspergillus karnatakaensis]|uniref:uncharacterized protein n=1 Tax=Aspergillus karnatakaensis TaxID=1810916 RepID=UPI003CCDBA5A
MLAPPLPTMTTTNDPSTHARHLARWKVKSGFWDYDEIIESVASNLESNLPEDGEPAPTEQEALATAKEIVSGEWNARLRVQSTWPSGPTNFDKLQRAFDSLERRGIVARMNWSCCRTCGRDEMDGERDDESLGYVFFHEQSTEALANGREDVALVFGRFVGSKIRVTEIGRIVVRVIRRTGFSVRWNGDAERAIVVTVGMWRRRIGEDDAALECDVEEEGGNLKGPGSEGENADEN